MKQAVTAHKPKPIALTFDDGPSEWTRPLLDLLAWHHARATFFVLGQHIVEHESVLRLAITHGHEIAVPGWDHRPVDELSRSEIEEHLSRTGALVLLAGAKQVRWWRPPWHRTTPQALDAAEALGLSYCGVTLDTFDVNRSADVIVKTVQDDVAPRAIVGLHDGVASNGNHETPHRRNTVEAVERLLVSMSGPWSFVTVSELLA